MDEEEEGRDEHSNRNQQRGVNDDDDAEKHGCCESVLSTCCKRGPSHTVSPVMDAWKYVNDVNNGIH